MSNKKRKKTAINLLISDFWSSDIIQHRPPLLKGKEENFCHYHSLKNREKKEREGGS
jgi:hypothetical protein